MSTFETETYVDPFATYIDTPAAGGAGNSATKSSVYHIGRLVMLQRWNTVLRVLTFVFTLVAIFTTFFASQQSSQSDGTQGWVAKYKYFTSFQFLLYTNIAVCLYALVISIIALITGRMSSRGLSTPASMMMPILVLNATACVFLLLAFAAGAATEIINRRGWEFSKDGYYASSSWKLCDDYSTFCVVIELGLCSTGLAFLSLSAGTAIDGYYKAQVG